MKIFYQLICSMACMLLLSYCGTDNEHGHSGATVIDKKVDSVLELMNLEEKIGQLNQLTSVWGATGPVDASNDSALADSIRQGLVGSMLNVTGAEVTRLNQKIAVEESRLGIPLLYGYDVIHGYKTIFPVPLAEVASWDMEALEKSARIAAIEAASSGIHWTFAPMIDVCRDPRWGRIMEGAGEDPYLGSRAALARVNGFQGDDLGNVLTIAACAKHFAGYGFPLGGRDYNTAEITDYTLHNVVLPPFKAAKLAGVKTFMNSFNDIGGIPSTGSHYLQRDILKGKWNFDGFIVSDWGSIGELVNHGVATDDKDAAMVALNAGSDMDMESRCYVHHLKELVDEGLVDEALIDDAVRRILKLKFELGLFDDPYKYCDLEREEKLSMDTMHMEHALEMAKKSIVLLKNKGQLLPFDKKGKTIAVIGPLGDDKDAPLGNWRAMGKNHSAVSLLEGIKNLEGQGNTILFAKGCEIPTNENPGFSQLLDFDVTDKSGFLEALNLARQADLVILALGEHAFMSGEARSQSFITLTPLQQDLMKEIQKVNPNIVLVLFNGRPLDISWANGNIPAIVNAWLLGHQSGNAIAQVLFGDYNPSGKLPVTFPRALGQVPIYYNHRNNGRPYTDSLDLFGCRYVDLPDGPLFPFGYGLSYTTFEYSDMKLSKQEIKEGEELEVSLFLTNKGQRAGEEVVQLYIRDMVGSIALPVKQLKAFRKVKLEAGQTELITFKITTSDLKYYGLQKEWQVDPGLFKVFVGPNSRDVQDATFELVK